MSQGQFSLEELSNYLNIEQKSIYKNINQINKFLKDENISEIKLNKGLYFMDLSNEEWKNLFSRNDFITHDEIFDYLYLKFIHDGFINLEAEKNILNISRSSILRCFNEIKLLLASNGTEYEYIFGKGLKITFLSKADKDLFCKKFIKFFIKNDFYLNHSTFLVNLIKDYEIEKLLFKLYNIFRIIKIPITHFVISFLCSLYICNKVFDDFDFKGNYEYNNYSELHETIKSNLSNFDKNYQEQFFYFVVKLLNKDIDFESEISTKSIKLLEKIKTEFSLNVIEQPFENLILKKINLSIFKYDNKIFKIKNIKISNQDLRILKILNKILNNLNLDIFYSDKIVIIHILKKYLISSNISRINNVLLLFNEVIITDDLYLKKNLNIYNNSLSFDMKPSLFYKLNYQKYNEKYDLILTDEAFSNLESKCIKSFNYTTILKSIDDHVLDIVLNDLY